MNAAEVAAALSPGSRPRRSSRGPTWRVRCPAHSDRHPSLDVTEAGDSVLLICRAGCGQRELIEALRAQGLWQLQSPEQVQKQRSRRREIEAALLAGRAANQHYPREKFDLRFRIAFIRAELTAAAKEITALYQQARETLGTECLARELRIAVEVGGIGTAGFDNETVNAAIERLACEITGQEAVHAN